MRLSDITESPRGDIADFSTGFDNPNINTRVQSQAARKNPAWKKSLVKLMAKHGFELVGAGVNGAVFQHPGYAYVLKVYRTDKMFDEWMHFVRTHQNNRYVPKVKGQTIRLNSVFSAVRLEPLQPCGPTLATQLTDSIENIAQMTWKDKEKIDAIEDRDLVEIAKFMREWEQVSDLTAHNVMARQDGQMVIVDPLYLAPGQVLEW